MSSIHVEVTVEDIIAGVDPDSEAGHNRFWATPIEEALARIVGVGASIDGGDGTGCIATIGTQESTTLVLDLPAEANRFLDRRWNGEADGEPFGFDIEIEDWLVRLVRDDRPLLTLREAAAALGVMPATLRQQAQDEWNGSPGPTARARRLGVVKLGRDWFVDRVAVEREAAR